MLENHKWPEEELPTIILVEPQMGENIGAVARIMSNFNYSKLRIVAPRDGWPNQKAIDMAAHGAYVLDDAKIYDSTEEAIADVNYLLATSAQRRDMNKPAIRSNELQSYRNKYKGHVAVMFGCERTGLSNKHLQMADLLVTIPVSKQNPSLNLAQSAAIICYELSSKSHHSLPQVQALATKKELDYFLSDIERKLINSGFLRNEKMRESMCANIRNIFIRAELTEQDVKTLHGIFNSLTPNNLNLV